MPRLSQKPSLARLSAIFAGLVLGATITVANAQSLPDIQRLMKQGQLPQALDKTDAYIASKPRDPQGRFMRGLILTEMGRTADAIAVFTKLAEDFPELPEPYNNLAVLYAQQKQYDKARTALEMAIRTHPSYSIAHENLGDVYAKLASQAYDKALQLDSSNKSTQTKLSMIKEMITTSGKPPAKPGAAAPRSEAVEPAKPAEPVKIAAAPAKPAEKPAAPEKAAPEKTAEKAPEKATPKPVEKAPEPVAAKPAESKEAKPSEKTAAAPNSESDITRAVQSWASACSRKDVKTYLASYASDFQTPNGMSRKAWEAERTQRIDKPGKLQVNVEDLKVSLSGDKATVKFRQHYTSATLKSSASKTLVLVRSGNRWLIQQERVS